jgi:hypothetical protein
MPSKLDNTILRKEQEPGDLWIVQDSGFDVYHFEIVGRDLGKSASVGASVASATVSQCCDMFLSCKPQPLQTQRGKRIRLFKCRKNDPGPKAGKSVDEADVLSARSGIGIRLPQRSHVIFAASVLVSRIHFSAATNQSIPQSTSSAARGSGHALYQEAQPIPDSQVFRTSERNRRKHLRVGAAVHADIRFPRDLP